jgi:pimeloyl-ACP methyl ester carboxylesterase
VPPSPDQNLPASRFATVPAGTLHYLEWGEPPARAARDRVILLLHGTAFTASIWHPVATRLVEEGYTTLAFDRRAHGRTAIESAALEFSDFADDVLTFTDALGLERLHGVGHSAGGTDLLLAAGRRPELFATVVAMEPTIMDPDRSRSVEPGLSPASRDYLDRVRARRAQFAGREDARQHFAVRVPYKTWRPDVLDLFLLHGLEDTPSGVRLGCRADDEASMLEPILQAMERRYGASAGESPFDVLRRVVCPVRLIANRVSLPYHSMTKVAETLLPDVGSMIEWELAHCSPMEDPPTVADQILSFLSEHVPAGATTS